MIVQTQQMSKNVAYDDFPNGSISLESTNKKHKHSQMAKCGKNWTFEESKLYIQFLKENRKLFKNHFSRKSSKIFLQMSHYICSKSTRQCRTCHRALIRKFQNIKNIERELLKSLKQQKAYYQSPRALPKLKKEMENQVQVLCEKNKIGIYLNIQNIGIW